MNGIKRHEAVWCLLALFFGASATVAQEKPPAAAEPCSAGVALAATQLTMEKFKEAEESAKRVLAQAACGNERGTALHILGLASFQSAGGKEPELRRSIALFEEGIGLGGPSLHSSRLILAHAHNLLGEGEKAVSQLRELLASLPAKDETAKDGRILLCQIRRHHPELRPEPLGNVSTKADSAKSQRTFTNPIKLSTPQPEYPAAPGLFARRSKGRVVIQATVDHEGCVVEPKIVSGGNMDLESAALEKVAEWSYLPATMNGAVVPFELNLGVEFKTRAVSSP